MSTIDPIRIYEIKGQGTGQVSTVRTFSGAFAVAANQSVIAAVTGQRIRVLGFDANSPITAGQAVIVLTDGSAGTRLFGKVCPLSTASSFMLPLTDSGYFETSTSTGLFINVTSFAVDINVYYITYTP